MKKTILILFVLGFVSMNGYAQKGYKKDGKVYLECTVASGMPAGSVTTTPKCVGGTASNTTFRNGSTSTNPYVAENNKVFEKLEIDNADMAKPGEPTNFTMNWVTAYDGCKGKNTGGVTGWRLPTQRELMLIYIFRVQLESMTTSTFSNGEYWSSLENSNTSYNSWGINLDGGYTGSYAKTSGSRVRCVREVTL